jgi:hypothetical protein
MTDNTSPDTRIGTSPIVGMSHHPPAWALIDVLALNHPLVLRHEPQNAFDPNALAIWVQTASLDDNQVEALNASSRLRRDGLTTDDLLARDEWQLGYIPAALAKALFDKGYVAPFAELPGEFTTLSSGRPCIRFTTPRPNDTNEE